MSAKPFQRSQVIDSLRMSAEDIRSLVDNLEKEAEDYAGHNKRADVRFALGDCGAVIVQFEHPGGTTQNYATRPRNISNGGVAVLHGTYVHEGTRSTLLMRDRENAVKPIAGRVAFCRLIAGRIHEVGIRFEQKIDVDRFIEPRTDNDTTTYRIAGRVVCCDETPEESHLVKFQLEEMGAEVQVVQTAAEVVRHLSEQESDVTMVGENMPDANALEFVAKIKKAGYRTHTVMLTTSDDPTLTKRAVAAGMCEVVVKPYDIESLLRGVREHMAQTGPGDPGSDLLSGFWTNAKLRPLILTYLEKLDDAVIGMEVAIREQDAPTLERKSREIKGSAGNYGFPQISLTAGHVLRLVENKATLDEVETAVYEIAQMVRLAVRTASRKSRGESNHAA